MSLNVWADLGFDDAAGMQRKCDISIEIEKLIHEARLSSSAAARAMGITPEELSAILRAHVEDTTVEELETHLAALQTKLAQRA